MKYRTCDTDVSDMVCLGPEVTCCRFTVCLCFGPDLEDGYRYRTLKVQGLFLDMFATRRGYSRMFSFIGTRHCNKHII